jgi:hypothetical protein
MGPSLSAELPVQYAVRLASAPVLSVSVSASS